MTALATIRVSVLVLLLSGVAWVRFEWQGPRPIVATVKGAPSEMGAAVANLAPEKLELLKDRYLRGIVCHGSDELLRRRSEQARAYFPLLSVRHQAEMRAFAKAAELPLGAAMLANSFLDMEFARAGCRSLVATAGDRLYHAHNLDWDTLAGMANRVICVVRRKPKEGAFDTVAVTIVGLLGALDIINEHGIALSVNQSATGAGARSEPTFLRIRRIAEECRTFDEARQALREGGSEVPFHITLSSARQGKAAVFESGPAFTERPLTDGVIGIDNSHWGRKRSPVENVALAGDIAEVDEVKAVLRSPEVLLRCNIYSVIFDYANNRMWLAAGRTPAAPHAYREYRLFRRAR